MTERTIELLDKAVKHAGLLESPFSYLWQRDWDELDGLVRSADAECGQLREELRLAVIGLDNLRAENARLRELVAELVDLLKSQPASGDDDKLVAWFHRKRELLERAGAR